MTKNSRRTIKHTIRVVAICFAMCLVMGMGIVSLADDKGTVIPASAKIRAAADASSTQVGSVAQGGNVDIIGKTTGTDGNTWYQVYVDANTKGYIRADLVKVAGTGTISEITSDTSTTTSTTTTTTTDASTTQVTTVDSKKCTVITSAKIRKGASTDTDIIGTANNGTTLTVTGEANGSDGKVWYQVSFTYNSKEVTGFIRSDLVTFDSSASDPAVSEIQGEANEEENVEQETEAADEADAQETSDNSSSDGIVLMNVDETPYVLPGFTSVSLNWNDETIKAYSNGGFYLFYARMENGDEGWYMFDSEKGEYQRYVYTSSSTATIPKSSDGVGIIPVIILIIIIIILVAVIGLLLIKLREASYEDGYEDYSDDSDEGDLEFEEIQPRRQQRQPQGQPQGQQSMGVQRTRPQGQPVAQGNGTQQAQGQQKPATAQRRPQAQGQQGNGTQYARPQGQYAQGQQNVAATQRRPQQAQGQQARPNANVQNRRPQQRPVANADGSQGYKAKTILDNQDDDMDFIDL
jgi:hypothetical protein